MNNIGLIEITDLVAALRKHGYETTAPEIIQELLESENCHAINDGYTIRVYDSDTGDMLMILPVPNTKDQFSEVREVVS
jgi:hypothetical protein